jgi:hypothetical protein
MATVEELTANLIDAGDNLFLDDQGNWQSVATYETQPNQWAWTEDGIVPIGGVSASAVIDPYLGIQEQYRGGAPIEAETWQEAVQKSLEGFMRANYGIDPIFNWDPLASGGAGSQFRIGTLQELANTGTIPGMFFDTSGAPLRHPLTGELTSAGVNPGGFDPLLGMTADTKLLGFEDIPLEQVEKLVGAMPENVFVLNRRLRMFGLQRDDVRRQLEELGRQFHAGDVSVKNSLTSQIQALEARDREITARIEQEQRVNPNIVSLEEARSRGELQDFNDFIFQLNIGEYAPPPRRS